MSRYPALVAAIQQRRALKRAILVRLEFASQTMLLWAGGVGPVRTLDPLAADPANAPRVVWSGVGKAGTVSDIDRALVSSAAPTLSLSGVDSDLVAKSLHASDEVKGQPCRIFEQYFDEDSQVVDRPIALYSGLMDRAPIRLDGPNTHTITLSLVTLLYRRRRPAQAYLSQSTQQLLHPGDDGADQIPLLVRRDRSWPSY